MSQRRIYLLAIACSLALLPTAAASAQDDGSVDRDPASYGQIEMTGRITLDDQYTRYSVPLTCNEAQAGRSDCLVHLTTSYQRTGSYPKFTRTGSPVIADERDVTIPVGGEHRVVVTTTKVLDALVRYGGNMYVDVSATLPGSQVGTTGTVQAIMGSHDVCAKRDRLTIPWKGKGRVRFVAPKGGDAFGRVSGTVTRKTLMTQGSEYRVEKASITITARGVTTTLSKGTRFIITCVGVNAVAGGKMVMSPYLYTGKASVRTTKSKMRQPAAYIVTSEGVLGTRKRETSRFTVTRSGSKRISRLRVTKGRSGGITPFNTPHRSPCTQGRALKVDRRGRISRA